MFFFVFFLQVVFARFSELNRGRVVSKSFRFKPVGFKKKPGWLGAKDASYGMPDLKNGTLMVGRKPFVRVLDQNFHYFRRIVDGHQPNSRGLYSHKKDFPIKGYKRDDHPKYRELTGTHVFYSIEERFGDTTAARNMIVMV